MALNCTTLVLHVKEGYEDRRIHMERMLKAHGISFEYILDGDMCDITEEILDRYFTSETMHQVSPHTSCALKHLYACEYIVKNNLKGALVLEDDMELYANFDTVFGKCLEEIDRRQLQAPLVAFDDSNLRFVPRSQRRKGIFLYPAQRDRYTGCLYYSYGVAKQILDYVAEHKCDLFIDGFHTALIGRIGLHYYWSHPTIASQGTHNGLFASSINADYARKQGYRARAWYFKLLYKKLLYFFR